MVDLSCILEGWSLNQELQCNEAGTSWEDRGNLLGFSDKRGETQVTPLFLLLKPQMCMWYLELQQRELRARGQENRGDTSRMWLISKKKWKAVLDVRSVSLENWLGMNFMERVIVALWVDTFSKDKDESKGIGHQGKCWECLRYRGRQRRVLRGSWELKSRLSTLQEHILISSPHSSVSAGRLLENFLSLDLRFQGNCLYCWSQHFLIIVFGNVLFTTLRCSL